MSKLLYIKASPRGRRSQSIAVADAFVEAYKQKRPEDEIVALNLFDVWLPDFDGLAVQAKYTIFLFPCYLKLSLLMDFYSNPVTRLDHGKKN